MKKILYSPGYGAGWSTVNDSEFAHFLLTDPTLVKMAEEKATADQVTEYLKTTFPHEDYFCVLGWQDIEVKELKEGTAYTIDEYDGSESVRIANDVKWWMA